MTTLFKNFSGLFKKRSKVSFDPGRDWLLLIAGCCAFFLISVAWNVWFFSRVTDEGVGSVGAEGGSFEAYESSRVKELFNERALEAQAYRETYQFIDPSR